MVSRVIFTSNGSGVPSRVRVMVMSEPTGPRIRSTASFSVRPITLSPSTCGDEVAGLDAGPVGRRALDRRHDLDEAVLLGDLDAEPAELALGLHPHVVEVPGGQVARMRIQMRQHPVDRALDQLLVLDLLDIGGADALEDVAEEVELLVNRLLLVGLLRQDRCGELGAHHRARHRSADPRQPDLLLH